jgi:RNA polymerase sigma factor (sigma-70 family)
VPLITNGIEKGRPVIGHPNERDVERWRCSDAATMRTELDRALGWHIGGEPSDSEAPAPRQSSERRPPDRDPDATRWTDGAKESSGSDAELIEAVRAGTVQAYGQLYARHVNAARNLARQLSRSPIEADDLVSDAFAKVLTSLCAGGGPESAFRAYLLTALRHTAYDKTRRDRKLELADDMEAVAGTDRVTGLPSYDAVMVELEQSLAARAFASLPERWQTVLWHTEIEGQPPAEVAPLLGLTSNGVAALAYRAREGLRKAYLQAHVMHSPSERCRATAAKLGSWTRDGLSKHETAQVEAHLDKCAACRGLAAELADVNGALRGIVAPLVLGIGATGYLAAGAGKASAAVSIATSSAVSVPPWLGVAASAAAFGFAIASGVETPDNTLGPTAVAPPPASISVGQTPTVPIGQTSLSSPTAVSTPTAAPPPGSASSAAAPRSTTSPTNAAPTLTPTAPGSFATSTGGPPTRFPITIRNTGSAPAPPTTLTLSLPDDVKVVGPGNNLRSAPMLELNGAAQRTVSCPAGKDTVICSDTRELAPGESVTFVFRLLAGPKAVNGTITGTTGAALPLRIEVPVTITPKK